MRNTTKIVFGLLIAAALFVALTSLPCLAAVTTADSDKSDTDGFTPEAKSVTVYPNFDSQTTKTYQPCPSGSVSPKRDGCVDPATKDLFVILWPALSDTLFPAGSGGALDSTDPLQYLKQSSLGVGIHRLDRIRTVTSRYLTAGLNYGQMATRVQENNTLTCDQNGSLFGSSTWGTPNGSDNAVVYTLCIKGWVTDNSVNALKIYLNDVTADLDTLIKLYVKHTIAHEAGHTMSLTATSNVIYNGNHYAPGTGSVMDQVPVVRTNADTSVSWYIPTAWIATDKSGVKLK